MSSSAEPRAAPAAATAASTAASTATASTAASTVARILLEIGAVHARPSEPFTFTSGLASPVYIDCRKIISFPRARGEVMRLAAETVSARAGYERFDAVAGGETAGIPFAAWLADRLALPMLYVRKKPKGFGRDARIEGLLAEGARVLLVEDLTTDGGSKIAFARALREAGAEVAHTFSVFYYGLFDHVPDRLAAEGLTLHHLAAWRDVLDALRESGAHDADTLEEVERFVSAPLEWSAAHGGVAELPVAKA